MAEWLERQLYVQYSIDCGIESVCGANLLLACALSRTFLVIFLSSRPPFSSVAAAQRTLPPRWQTGGCRRVAAGRRVAFGRRVAAGRRAVADGPSHWRGGHVQDFLACWGGGARGWSSCCYGGQRGSGQLRLALMFGLLYSVKLTATNTAEKSYELS